MLTDGLQLLGSSKADNFSVDNGPNLPTTDNNLGELFFKTSGAIGLYVYDGSDWKITGSELTNTSIAAALGFTPAALDGTGKLTNAQVPSIAITDTSVVASQAAMLALTAEVGDVAVRTDLNKSFILKATPATNVSNWQELLTPTGAVQSVNGQTGVVSLTTAQVAEVTNMYFTQARARSAISLTAGSSGATYDSATGVLDLSSLTSGGGSSTLSSTQVGFGSASNLLSGSSSFTWDNTARTLTTSGSGNPAGSLATVRILVGDGTATTKVGLHLATQTFLAANGNKAPAITWGRGGAEGATDGAMAAIDTLRSASYGGNLAFYTQAASAVITDAPIERFRITATGAFALGAGGTAVGTSGQVLTSSGDGPPSWTTPSSGTTFTGGTVPNETRFTGSRNGVDSATTYVSIGQDSGASGAEIQFMQASASAGNKASRIKISTGGAINWTLTNDGITSSTNFMTVNRSGDTATEIIFATTAFKLTGLTGGLHINGDAGTTNYVLTSQGSGAAPIWKVASGGATASGTGSEIQFRNTTGGTLTSDVRLSFVTGSTVTLNDGLCFVPTGAGTAALKPGLFLGLSSTNSAANGSTTSSIVFGGQNLSTDQPIGLITAARSAGYGGSIIFYTQPVNASPLAATEKLRINEYGGLGLSGANYGGTGQVLTSGGATGVASWTTISATVTQIQRVTTFDATAKGKRIAVTAGFTIPNSTYAAGDVFSFYNDSALDVTITQASGLTLRLDGTDSTGNRTLRARGTCTVWFNSATEAIVSGSVF